MSVRSIFSTKNPWFTVSVAAVVAVAVVAAFIGFVLVPRAHARDAMASLWESICRAAGAPAGFRYTARPGEQDVYPTAVVVNAGMMGDADEQSIGRGGTLALNCTMCHGARGTSPAGTPHLAGQPASSTYKQLRDYKSGHRKSAIMQPLVANLSDQDMRDLAAYFASLERERHAVAPANVHTPRLVRNGDPMRNVGACATCHSPYAARPATPVLDGMNESYLRAQLDAFRKGERANDINAQMRNATRQLTQTEVAELAKYYASR